MDRKASAVVIGIDIGKNTFSPCRPRQARGDRAASEAVTRPGRGSAREHAAMPDRPGGVRRRPSFERQLLALGHDVKLVPDSS
jgi:hypothetical protein